MSQRHKMVCFFKFPLENSLGGAEFHTLRLAQHWLNSGKEVKLLTSDKKLYGLFEQNNLPRKLLFAGLEPTSKKALLVWPLTYLIAKLKFRQILKTLPSESVFFFQSLTEKLLLSNPALKKGHKIFWLEHKVPGRWLGQNPLLGRYLKLASQVELITVSNFAKQEFIKLGVPEDHLKVIYPGVGLLTGNFSHPPSFTIGLLSRLDPEKGVFDFLKVVAPLLSDNPSWKILIAGEGKERKNIEQLIQKDSLANQVRLLGFVSNLDQFFSKISVLVYPSKTPESFGVAVLEGLARGIPVAGSRIGALPEIIEHEKSGFLIPLRQPAVWKMVLKQLEDRDFYEKICAGALVRAQNFAETKMFIEFDKLL